jgi:hypothetical protein
VDLGIQFFTAAKAQHESAAKWSLIVLVILLYFHLAIAGPFAQQTADKAGIEQALSDSRAIAAQLDPIVNSAAAFIASVDREVTEASTGLRDDMVGQFRALNENIQALAMLGPDDAEGELGAQLFGPDFSMGFQQQQQQVQQQPMPVDLGPMLEPMSPALRRLVAEAAQNPDLEPQFSAEMERYITAFIITPAFARANDSWAAWRLPRLTGEAAQLTAGIDASVAATGAASGPLNDLRAALGALGDEAQILRFAPPTSSDWWRSVAGKETSIRSMVEAMRRGADNLGQQQDLLQAARDTASQAVAANQQRAKEVEERLADLDRQARELQAQLGEIGEPLKVISIRLSILAPLLPLVIALAIAALTLWRTDALHRMHFAASLVAGDGDGGVLRRWLQEAAGGTAQRLMLREAAVGAVACAWVLAAWQAVRLLPLPHLSGTAIIAVALAVVIGARAYHWYRARGALALAGQR